MKRICINEKCGWIGEESDCLDWKHPIGERFCPECHEVTEEISLGIGDVLERSYMTKKYDVQKLEIAKLELKPGDILAIRVDSIMSQVAVNNMQEYLKSLLPEGVKTLIYPKNVELSIVNQATQIKKNSKKA